MAIKTAIELEVKQPSLKGFRQELRQATIDAQNAVIKFGEFSPEAVKAANKVAELRDRMDDFNDRVKAVNPDKFAQLNTVVSSVANGFQAAQGAMVLLGGTTKDVEQTFVKLQAAMALSQGLEGLGKMSQQLRQLAASATTFQKAMAGSLGVIILIASNFEKLTKVIPGLQKLGDIMKEIGFTISDFFGLGFREQDTFKKFKISNDLAIADIEKRIAILQTQEKTEREVFKTRKQLLEAQLSEVSQALQLEQFADEEQKQQLLLQQRQYNNSLEVLEAERLKYERDRNKEFEQMRQQHLDEISKMELKNKNEAIKTDNYLYYSQKAKASSEHYARLQQLQNNYQEQLQALDIAQREEIEKLGDSEKRKLEITEYYRKLRLNIENQYNKQSDDEQKKWENQKLEFDKKVKQQLYDNSIQLANAIIALAGEQSKVGKIVAIGTLAADTGVALGKALSNSQSATPDNIATGGLAGIAKYVALAATILTNAKKARDIIKGQGTFSASGTSTPNISVPVPQMSMGSTVGQDMGGGKVYVLEGDIRRVTQRVNANRMVSVSE